MIRSSTRSHGLALLSALVVASGCAEDACKSEPASFELAVSAPSGVARVIQALEVDVTVGADTWRKRYPLEGRFTDGATALGVRVEPAPTAAFAVKVVVRAIDGEGAVRAQGTTDLDATPDGCNRASLALGIAGPMDGGVDGGGPADADAGVAPDVDVAPDTGVDPDAGVDPDSGVEPDSGVPADTGVPPDSGVPPDTGVPPDSGTFPDASAPDAGGTPFPYAPSNFDPGAVGALVPRVQLNCGETIFNSSTGMFTNDCGRMMPTMVLTPQPGGATAALLAVAGLDILPGSALRVQGDRPVIIAVFGNATIAGRLDARGLTTTAGAGGGNGADCLTGAGAPPSAGVGGGGGGSFSTAGTNGGAGGSSGGAAGTPGGGSAPLVPLRGGCGGAAGAGPSSGAAGAAGGAIQVSAAGTLSVPGEVNAGGGGGSPGTTNSGGGGGGSGGGVLLEGRSAVIVGTIVANGGGGGGGGGSSAGMPGGNGATSPATGGTAGTGAGAGGNGATRTSLATLGAAGSGAGGGGGGAGGLGRVRINATMCSVGGSISPAHTGCP